MQAARPPQASATATPPRPPRRRLPAAQRVTQILDAALQVFTEKGFAASRIDDIGQVAGLSKGGIYTHFDSKEAIFEALLARSLASPAEAAAPLPADEAVTVDLLIEHVIAPAYRHLAAPDTLATLRLLLADGMRAPQHVARWQSAVVDTHRAELERLLRRGVRQGTLRRSVLLQAPWLVMAPALHMAIERLVRPGIDAAEVARQQAAHVALLRELLSP